MPGGPSNFEYLRRNTMNNKPPGYRRTEDMTDAEYIRTAVSELNESIAYLSKMVLQLQRSINSNNRSGEENSKSSEESPKTLH